MGFKKIFLILVGLSVGLIGCQKDLTITNDFARQTTGDQGLPEDGGSDTGNTPGFDYTDIENNEKLSAIAFNEANSVLTDINNDADLNVNLSSMLFGDKIDRVKGKITNFFDRIILKLEHAKDKISEAKDKIQTNIDKLDQNDPVQAKIIKKLQYLQGKLDVLSGKVDGVIAKVGLFLDKIDSKINGVIAKLDDGKWYNLILIYQLTKMKDDFMGPLFDRLSSL